MPTRIRLRRRRAVATSIRRAVVVTLALATSTPAQTTAILNSDRPGMKPRPFRAGQTPATGLSKAVGSLNQPYQTFIGGSGEDHGIAFWQTVEGHVIAAIQTTSPDLPTTPGAFQTALADTLGDGYIVRFDPESGERIWATYFGSEAMDWIFDMVCDVANESCYIGGATEGSFSSTSDKMSQDVTNSLVARLHMDSGDILGVYEGDLEGDDAINAMLLCGDVLVTFGFWDTGVGLDAQVCATADLENGLTCTDASAVQIPGDQTVFDGVCNGSSVTAVGANDPTGNGVFEAELTPFIFLGTVEYEAPVVSWSESDGKIVDTKESDHYYERIAGTGDGAYVIGPSLGEPVESNLWCYQGPVNCGHNNLSTCIDEMNASGEFACSTCNVWSQSLGIGFSSLIDVDAAGNIWIVSDRGGIGLESAVYLAPGEAACKDDIQLSASDTLGRDLFVARFQAYLLGSIGSGQEEDFQPSENALDPTCEGEFTCATVVLAVPDFRYHTVYNLDKDGWELTHTLDPEPSPNFAIRRSLDFGEATGMLISDADGGWTTRLSAEGEQPIDITSETYPQMIVATVVLPDDHLTAGLEEVDSFPNIFFNATPGPLEVSILDNITKEEIDRTNIPPRSAVWRPSPYTDREWEAADIAFRIAHLPGLDEFYEMSEEDLEDIRQNVLAQSIPTSLLIHIFFGDDSSGKLGSSQNIGIAVFNEKGRRMDHVVTTASERQSELPAGFRLDRNYPNPFTTQTSIPFELPSAQHIRIDVHDVTGRTVTTLVDDFSPAGWSSVTWNGTDGLGRLVASGVYFYRMTVDGQVAIGRMVKSR